MNSGGESRPRRWVWLFPLTYIAHIAEEVWGREGFAAWINRVSGFHMTTRELIVSNAAGLLVMTIGVELVSRSAKWRWVLTALAGIVLANFLLHTIGSTISRSYSPGLITSGLLWFPLGLFTLSIEWRRAARSTFVKGLIAMAAFHVLLIAAIAGGFWP